MTIRAPHFANTLLFRIAATFLLLLGVSLGGWYLWIESTVFAPYADEAEQDWYENLAEDELDDLAGRLATLDGDTVRIGHLLAEYGDQIGRFGAEVIVFDPQGRHLSSSTPDSLAAAVGTVDPVLLRDMSGDSWDYGSYPNATHIDAYVNRIFEVDRIMATDDQLQGYLVASYEPVDVLTDDLNRESALLDAQNRIVKMLAGLLIYSALMALLIMAWTGRRVQRLSASVATFAGGDLSHRADVRSTDEIGQLGRNFNGMAAHIQDMVEELRQKEQFQRQLIANVSHDLRTPMASMRGYVETMLMDTKLDAAERDRYLKILTGNLDHLDRLVAHMLVLSRFDSGQATFRLENFPIAELADDILVRCEGLAREKEVELALNVSGAVGLVHADPLQISQVLQNLVENAIKFNRPGGRVVVTASRLDDRVRIEVRDTGCGIPAADLPHIFDRFFTGDESRTRTLTGPDQHSHGHHLAQSSGLGLAIAAKIVAGHDSVLRVESRVGAGSSFHFQLAHAEGEREASVAD